MSPIYGDFRCNNMILMSNIMPLQPLIDSLLCCVHLRFHVCGCNTPLPAWKRVLAQRNEEAVVFAPYSCSTPPPASSSMAQQHELLLLLWPGFFLLSQKDRGPFCISQSWRNGTEWGWTESGSCRNIRLTSFHSCWDCCRILVDKREKKKHFIGALLAVFHQFGCGILHF